MAPVLCHIHLHLKNQIKSVMLLCDLLTDLKFLYKQITCENSLFVRNQNTTHYLPTHPVPSISFHPAMQSTHLSVPGPSHPSLQASWHSVEKQPKSGLCYYTYLFISILRKVGNFLQIIFVSRNLLSQSVCDEFFITSQCPVLQSSHNSPS